MCGLAVIYITSGRLQEALELAQNGIRVHQAAEEPSVLGIQNCQTLIHEIKQRRNQGT
jgi:hypothetical protein